MALLDYFSIFSTLVPLAFLIFTNRAFNSPILKVLFIYLLISAGADFACFFLALTSTVNTKILLIYTFSEFTAICLIYFFAWEETGNYRKNKLLIFCPVVLCAFLSGFNSPFYSDISTTIEAVFIIFLSVLFFFRMINHVKQEKLHDYPFFWLNTAFLTYFSTVLFVFLFTSQILNPTAVPQIKGLWMIHNFFHIVYNCLLAFGIFKCTVQK